MGRPQEEPALPWIHLAYNHFRLRLQNFSRLVAIYPEIMNSLAASAHDHSSMAREMVRL